MKSLTLLETADLLAELLEAESITAGCIDASELRTIGVYQRGEAGSRECIGTDSSYQMKPLRILIHWNSSTDDTEQKAQETADLIDSFDHIETDEHTIICASSVAVRSIGKDEKGVCEYIVDADIIYTGKD